MGSDSISIALPVYNGANYIREALDSILAQDFVDFELVISDNCSTDETPDILNEYAQRDSRIRVSRSETFIAQADNVNRAIELCKGTWVKLFCHDDIMKPTCLSVIHQAIVHECNQNVALIGDGPGWQFENGFQYSPYDSNLTKYALWQGTDWINQHLLGIDVAPLPSLTTATVRRDVFISSKRFDKRYVHFDSFYWMELLTKWDYVFISQFITITRIHGLQVAVDVHKTLGTVRELKKFWPEFLAKYADQLHLNRIARLRAKYKHTSSASSFLAIALMKRQLSVKSVYQAVRTQPIYVLPLLLFLILRSLRVQSMRVAAFRQHVPLEQIYPG